MKNEITQELMIDFLIKVAIPPQSSNNKYPEFARSNIQDKRIWDAIYRAHRDVLTGRKWLTKYCNNYGHAQSNEILEYFFKLLIKDKCIKSSIDYIIQITEKYDDVEFGAIQKLVNMTLKYLLILNTFDEGFDLLIDSQNCDCPLDSIILNKLKNNDKKWTQLKDENEYKEIQEKIDGGLYFDFINW